MKIRTLFFAFAAIAASMFASCTALFPEGENAIRIDATEYSVPAEGGEVQIKFVPVLAWTAACEEEWLTFSPASGDASAEEVIMTLSADSNGLSMRTAEIILSTSAGEVTITLIQESVGLDSLFQQTEYDVPVEGDDIKIKFTAPVDWIAECEEDWISLSPESGQASARKKTLTVTVDSNEGGKARTAHVYIIFADDTVEIKIRQEGDSSDNSGGSDDTNAPTDPSDPTDPSGPNDDGSDAGSAKSFTIEVTTDNGDSWVIYNLSPMGAMYVCKDIYMPNGAGFYLWESTEEKFYGCSSDYLSSYFKTNACVSLDSGYTASWFRILREGYYDIYINPKDCCIYIMSAGHSPNDLPSMEQVFHEVYDTIMSVKDGQWVKVYATVMAKNAGGYILAINTQHYNNVYVSDPDGLLDLKLGCHVDLYAKVESYNGLKRLVLDRNQLWYQVMADQEYDFEAEAANQVGDLYAFSSNRFEYISTSGTLFLTSDSNGTVRYQLGESWYCQLSIAAPLEDLSFYEGKEVLVEGYYIGSETIGNVTYRNVVLKRIWEKESLTGGSTEDVLPGGPIIVTNN